jgi:Flp pilus assembly protein protease CpaA
MRILMPSFLLFASAFQIALGEVQGVWTYSVTENKATITSYSGAGGAVIIPDELGGYPVTAIAYNSPSVSSASSTFAGATPIFGWNNNTVTSVTIPNSVTTIGSFAFSGCSRLATMTLSNALTIIGELAFADCSSLVSVTLPNTLKIIGYSAFYGCSNLTNITIPNSVTFIGSLAFADCTALTSLTMPDRFTAQVGNFGISGQVATDYLINALANNDAFVTAVANKILAKSGNYGLSVKSELGTLATKSELTTALAESRTDGVNSVLSNPNLWTLYTTSQIQNMAVGDLVLTRQVNGGFVLNYDIEQSTDLQTWTRYQALSLPINGLPTDKAFVRIKAKQ